MVTYRARNFGFGYDVTFRPCAAPQDSQCEARAAARVCLARSCMANGVKRNQHNKIQSQFMYSLNVSTNMERRQRERNKTRGQAI